MRYSMIIFALTLALWITPITGTQNENGQTPLHVAAARERVRFPEFLAGEEDVNAKDKDGKSPFHLAAANNKTIFLQIN
ncbi:ankyrin repeats (3 copies) domain-containing protein [Ditylenchus destructor]|uniref:Ankyrin repeats (3 copies) domain-containing protein n=1 Tax=Ditylenchus destructor TaxID=166010 RepID=A0AAD4MID6_9BILA|nr:ankyrin repeats (3 copies) domain-containing protein [Ditylenchus destructor]